MACLECRCAVCEKKQSIPLCSVPREGLIFLEEHIEYPCRNCFRTGRVLDPRFNCRFISTGVYKDNCGRRIHVIFSDCLN